MIVMQIMDKLPQRTANIRGYQVYDPGGKRSKTADSQLHIQKNEPHLGAVQQVLNIVIGQGQFIYFVLQLRVNRHQFFVD